jgi:hypothetical protein
LVPFSELGCVMAGMIQNIVLILLTSCTIMN